MSQNIDQTTSTNKIVALVVAIVAMAGIPTALVYTLQQAHSNTDTQQAIKEEEDKKKKEIEAEITLNKKLAEENPKLGYVNSIKSSKPDENFGKYTMEHWAVKWQTNYGPLKIHLHAEDAPKSVENFLRLNSRKVYDKSISHRMVKSDNMTIIQGGDYTQRNGQGGESAFYISDSKTNLIPDELWKKAPVINSEVGTATGGEFRNPKFYTNYDSKTGLVTYPKGLILMAKTSQPDSASSQFFITLKDTILPAQYTVFGRIDEANFSTLDKITTEVDPVKKDFDAETGEPTQAKTDDGEPNKEIIIESSSFGMEH
jgi:cyclophilin family peptidyl-prolyl cis-trans isomerase